MKQNESFKLDVNLKYILNELEIKTVKMLDIEINDTTLHNLPQAKEVLIEIAGLIPLIEEDISNREQFLINFTLLFAYIK